MIKLIDIQVFRTIIFLGLFNTVSNEYKSKHNLMITMLGCLNESINQGRSYDQIDININNCFFSRLSQFSGYGGVIYASGSYSMLVSSSMFINCLSSDGGAIYFLSPVSFLKKICANQCYASSHYHFAYIRASEQNEIMYLSLSSCSLEKYGFNSIYLSSGNQSFTYSNSSMNKAYQTSGISIANPSSFTSSHCTFSNNRVQNGVCIEFYFNSGTMFFNNIIDNNSPSWGILLVYGGTPKIYYCIFDLNQNLLFYIDTGSLEVSHCFLYHTLIFSPLASISMSNNNSITKQQTYQIQFFISQYCYADIPLLEQTPMNSPGLTQTIKSFHNDEKCSCPFVKLKKIDILFSCSFILLLIVDKPHI